MSDDFGQWIHRKLQQRGWSQRELARQVGMSNSFVSNIIAGKVPPSVNFCNKVALAFDMPPAKVLHKARLLPELPPDSISKTTAELIKIVENLSPDGRRLVLEYAQFVAAKDKPDQT